MVSIMYRLSGLRLSCPLLEARRTQSRRRCLCAGTAVSAPRAPHIHGYLIESRSTPRTESRPNAMYKMLFFIFDVRSGGKTRDRECKLERKRACGGVSSVFAIWYEDDGNVIFFRWNLIFVISLLLYAVCFEMGFIRFVIESARIFSYCECPYTIIHIW